MSDNQKPFIRSATLLVCLILCSCSPQHAVPIFTEFSASCRKVTGGEYASDPIRIAVDDSGLPDFGSLPAPPIVNKYAALAMLDCEGNLRPDAATSWSSPNGGKTWLLDFKKDLHLFDGSPLTAPVLSAFWQNAVDTSKQIDRIEPAGEYQLTIHLTTSHEHLPEFLISPAFALPVLEDLPGTIEVINTAGRDGRDVLESDVQGLITMDPDVIDYASRRPQWTNIPLPWDKSYVMVVRSGLVHIDNTTPTFPRSVAESLVQDVVSGDARAYQSPAWWEGLDVCDVSFETQMAGGLEPLNGIQNIRYLKDDPIAKGLSERMAALASGAISIAGSDSLFALLPGMGSGDYRWVAKEISAADEMDKSTLGFDSIYIIPLPRNSLDVCREIQNLKTHMPWLFDSTSHQPYTFIPLLDVRSTLIIKKGTVNVDLDGFGRLFISNPSRGDH